MTSTNVTDARGGAIGGGLPSSLADIVGDTGSFFARVWGDQPRSFRCPDGPRLLSQAEIWKILDCGLLVAPYFSVFREHVSSPVTDVTATRTVLNKPITAYADAGAIRRKVTSGHPLKLNQP